MVLRKEGISQEALKVLACVCMLIDHIGATLVSWPWLRVVGRISFPIYCYLLVEGFHHTANPYRYMDRLLVAAVLSELPFDFALYGCVARYHQNVMLTLLLGLLSLEMMEQLPTPMCKLLATIPVMYAADWIFCTDYGAWGILLIVLLGIVRDLPRGRQLQYLAIVLICGFMPSNIIRLWGVRVSIELFGGLAIVPLALYHGKKATSGKAVQWAFYLFYPVHLAILWLLRAME